MKEFFAARIETLKLRIEELLNEREDYSSIHPLIHSSKEFLRGPDFFSLIHSSINPTKITLLRFLIIRKSEANDQFIHSSVNPFIQRIFKRP